MTVYDRPLTDSLVRPPAQTPLLTVVFPTLNRPVELAIAVASVADQIDAELQGKVEIIISDNGSGPEVRPVLERLAETYPCITGWFIHAGNYGGMYQVCVAADRAHGRWTWVFGDDDALAPGGLTAVLEVLEREEPAFMTVNRQVWNQTLNQCVIASRHDLPDTRFDTFLDLLETFGFDQLSFFASQIYDTRKARALETTPYWNSMCRYAQLAYYVEVFHGQPAYYLSEPVVWHRWDAGAGAVHALNFHSLGTLLPELLQQAADRVGLAPGLFERISGRRSLLGPETRKTTFVDNILQNLWRCVASGTAISEPEWEALHRLSPDWRADRSEDLMQVHETHRKVAAAWEHLGALVANHEACAAPGRNFTPEELDLLRQSEAAIRTLQGNINDARKMAANIAANYGG